MNIEDLQRWANVAWPVLQIVGTLGSTIIFPALFWLYKVGHGLRAIYLAMPKLMRWLTIFANRERRGFDTDRRALNLLRDTLVILRNEARQHEWSHHTRGSLEKIWQELHVLQGDIMELRDTGFRSREVKAQRERRDFEVKHTGASEIIVQQGDLHAAALEPIEKTLKFK